MSDTRVYRILHVEDDPDQRDFIALLLQSRPAPRFEIAHAESEREAIERFSAEHDLVILDYQLAEGGGMGTLRKLRAIRPWIPILALSGQESPEVVVDLLDAGVDEYFSKSRFDPAQFLRSIDEALLRQEAWEARHGGRLHGVASDADPRPVELELTELLETFLAALPNDFPARVAQIVESAHARRFQPHHLHHAFDRAVSRLLGLQRGRDPRNVKPGQLPTVDDERARPLLLELLLRLEQVHQPREATEKPDTPIGPRSPFALSGREATTNPTPSN
ncbi:response regulator receiver protein [Isosphaera pallida ATCC 43644]|uniref:Response regulator receiver protein n=1 Tax=Isosphaera pallida (strain ATCC 43644 / DSM 9630 / IS1B) TaxID=575540 RepID=E8QZZ3_ISOPI|nr:response regulator [Isosphaera pallida]ADV64269.1 response regulator receiver protein [Isosphaera pallida ATCC 43644]